MQPWIENYHPPLYLQQDRVRGGEKNIGAVRGGGAVCACVCLCFGGRKTEKEMERAQWDLLCNNIYIYIFVRIIYNIYIEHEIAKALSRWPDDDGERVSEREIKTVRSQSKNASGRPWR